MTNSVSAVKVVNVKANRWLLHVALQTMEMARNPAMLQEMMRQQDRAMSNLEVSCITYCVLCFVCY